MAWSVGLSCGGSVQVFVEALSDATLAQLATIYRRLEDRQASALLTNLPSGEKQLITVAAAADANDYAAQAMASDRAQLIESEGGPQQFVQPFCPSPRLVIVGAVHIAQALAQLAAIAGFDVAIIDPRTTFATLERFPGVRLYPVWPGQALEELGLDARTAVVTLTHDPKLDDPALQAALRSPAFYVGSLGSGKTHAARLNRLRSRGFADADLARIHGPVGLRIGARSPSEIAVSILAQLIGVLRGQDRAE
jgi:xanthine dehydrogenase accessory factor